jgi:hypothetical protein
MDTGLVRRVARGLRYRPLSHLLGRVVAVSDLDRIEDAIRLSLGTDLPDGCRLAGPEPRFREGAVAKYGILDLRFTAPGDILAGDVLTGVPLLRELGYLPEEQVGPQHRDCDDPTWCLEMLQEDLDEGQTWLRLFLEGGRPGEGAWIKGPGGHVSLRVPEGYLPRAFRVTDACVTNANGVWLWKHFYL